MSIGSRIRSARKSAGMSQEELAEKAGLHNTYIGQLERGEKNATLESIEKVSRALEIPLEIVVPCRACHESEVYRIYEDHYVFVENRKVDK